MIGFKQIYQLLKVVHYSILNYLWFHLLPNKGEKNSSSNILLLGDTNSSNQLRHNCRWWPASHSEVIELVIVHFLTVHQMYALLAKKQEGPCNLSVIWSLMCTWCKVLWTLSKGHVTSCTCIKLLDSRQSEFAPASKQYI